MNALPWALVTPSAQGIGLALTRHLLRTTQLSVVATVRKDVKAAKDRILDGVSVREGRLQVLKVDVTGTVPPIPQSRSRGRDRMCYEDNSARTSNGLTSRTLCR